MQRRRNKRPNPYKEANEAFLQVKAQEEGIVVLDNGVLYRVLEEGHGAKKPTHRSIVYVNYTGRLIDGTVFDTTEGQPLPALFLVGDLIMGWQIVLTRMHEGDKWEVYIPAKWGYGAMKMDDIPAHLYSNWNWSRSKDETIQPQGPEGHQEGSGSGGAGKVACPEAPFQDGHSQVEGGGIRPERGARQGTESPDDGHQ